jgi:NADH-quinone oxidoreductase subunit J
MDQFIFWVAAIVAIIAAVRVVFLKNPIVSVLHLIVTLVALAVLFLQLSAEFIAALQIIVYAGAIMVLFLFIVMLLNLRKDEFGHDQLPWLRFLGTLAGAAFLAEFISVIGGGQVRAAALPPGFGGVRSIGRALFGEYLFPFELTSLLLVAAVVAAVVVARRRSPCESEDLPTTGPAGRTAGTGGEA